LKLKRENWRAKAGAIPDAKRAAGREVTLGAQRSYSALATRLDRIEGMLAALVERQTIKDYYSTEEFARLVGRSEFTFREWCRLGRIRAEKRRSGRGAHPAWVISHLELVRYQREGLLPQAGKSIK
jgi:hypothetical protein